MKYTLLRYSSIVMATTGLGLGVAAASSAGLSTTGPGSINNTGVTNNSSSTLTNTNTVGCNSNRLLRLEVVINQGACNTNLQQSVSGGAAVSNNTIAGAAVAGQAVNGNSLTQHVTINNQGNCSCGASFGDGGTVSISTTGPNSQNSATITNSNSATITNQNTVNLSNLSLQRATSGNATVSNNNTGGAATTGNSKNASSASTAISITN